MTEPFVPAELRLGDDEEYLVGIQKQSYVKVTPNQGSSGYTPTGTRQIEFNFNHGEATDFQQCYLKFDLEYSDVSSNMTLVSDCIERVEMYVDSQEIFTTTSSESRKLINYLLLGETNKNWYDREGKMFLGGNIPTLDDGSVGDGASRLQPQSESRGYVVPLWCIHPSFMMSRVFPVLGSQIRMVFHLASPDKCLNVKNANNSTYTLNNVSLMDCRTILSPQYKTALMNQVNSPEGFKIHMIDFDIIAHQVISASKQNLVVRNEHRNAQTLILYNDRVSRPAGSNAHAVHQTLFSNLGTRTKILRVDCGSINFTGVNGSTSLAEHFVHLERANGSLSNISQSGLYNYRLYKGNVTDMTAAEHGGTGANRFAVSPLMVSLEKLQAPDTDNSIVNNGLSAVDLQASREIEVSLEANTGDDLNPSTERLYSGLVYEKAVVLANGTILVEH